MAKSLDKSRDQVEPASQEPELELDELSLQQDFDNLPKEQKIEMMQMFYHRSGPLPVASELAEYEQISPGAADKIINMALKEQSHRHGMEQISIDHYVKQSTTGQWLGFGIAMSSIIAAGLMGYIGQTALAIVLVGGSLATLVGLFVRNQGEGKK